MIIEARGLQYAYPGGVMAVDALDLSIQGGERLAVLGANGAGKSTLLLMLNGSLKPQSGEISLDGTRMAHTRKALSHWRARVGLVMQDPDDQLFAATVFEDVSFGPLNLGLGEHETKARVAEALSSMGIADLAERPTHMLSFGQRKRAAIAGVLAMRPAILLLDEPTAGLDPAGTQDLLSALSALGQAGTAIVIATHDMEIAQAWATRVALFGDRRILANGPPERVFDDGDLLARLGLRQPILHAIAQRLRVVGFLAEDTPSPATIDDFVDLIVRRTAQAVRRPGHQT